MDTNKKNREYISALMDGEIPEPTWSWPWPRWAGRKASKPGIPYHHIGDLLRAEAGADLSPGFSERLAARLAAEPLPSKRSAAAEPSATTATAGPR
jgi:sigma-E factor negative regulatory protein RseA